jgi:TP901 family phage tail tape measure protein
VDDLVGIQVRLLGEAEVVAGNERIIASEKAVGDASKTASDESAEAAKAASAEEVKASKAAQLERDAAVKSLKRQKSATRELGLGMTKYITGAAIGIGAASVYMAANFQRQMNLISTDAGGSRKEVQGLSVDVKNLARETQYGPTELAEALFHVESSGYRGAKAMQVLRQATNLATAGNSDLESTTYGLVSAQKALYGRGSVSEVKKTAAELNEIVSHGDIRLEELVAGMGSGLIEKAVEAGVSLRSVGSALDVMTARGIPAQRSSYALGFIFSKLVPYTEKASEAFERLGIGQEELSKAARSKGGWPAMIDLLQSKLKGLSKGQKQIDLSEMFGGGRMDVAVLASLQNVGDLSKKYEELDGNMSEYNRHIHEGKATALIEMERTVSGLKTDMIELGEALLPVVVPAVHDLGEGAKAASHFMNGLSGSTKGLIGEAVGLAAALGPLILLGGKVEGIGRGLMAFSSMGGAAAGGEGAASMGPSLGARFGVAGLGVGASMIAGHAVGGTAGSLISGVGSGAAVGAAFGSVVPGLGTLTGAGVGAGVGALAEVLPGLLSHEKKLSPIQRELAASAKGMGRSFAAARAEVTLLDRDEVALTRTHTAHESAVKAETRAERQLNHARQVAGPDSLDVIRHEMKLAQARRGVEQATKAEQRAEREHGQALEATRELLRYAVLEERHRILVTGRATRQLEERRTQMKAEGASLQELAPLNKRLTGDLEANRKAGQRMAESLQEAGQAVGPRFAGLLRNGSHGALEYGSALGAARHKVAELTAQQREYTRAIQASNTAIEAGTLEEQQLAGKRGLERAEGELGGLTRHRRQHPHGKSPDADLLVRPSSNAWHALNRPPVGAPAPRRRGGGGRVETLQPVQVKVDGKKLAETVFSHVYDEESHL